MALLIFTVVVREKWVVKLETVRLDSEAMNVRVFFDVMIVSGGGSDNGESTCRGTAI